jgi:hypothetical protein
VVYIQTRFHTLCPNASHVVAIISKITVSSRNEAARGAEPLFLAPRLSAGTQENHKTSVTVQPTSGSPELKSACKKH